MSLAEEARPILLPASSPLSIASREDQRMEQGGLLFIGSKGLGLRVLETVATLIPARLSGIVTCADFDDSRSVHSGFQQVCDDLGQELIVAPKASDLTGIVSERRPDAALVAGWYQIIDGSTLEMVPNGFAGIHASLLPAYRGHAPLVWAIMNGDSKTGVSLFLLDAGMDTGPVIDQLSVPIEPMDYIDTLLDRATEVSCELVTRHCLSLLEGKLSVTPQNEVGASYGSRRRPSDGKIDWSLPAAQVFNSIRAQSHPYPGAFCWIDGCRQLRIWACKPFKGAYFGVPGLAQEVHGTGRLVCCGEGAIVVTQCSVDGETTAEPRDLIPWGSRLT